MDIVQCAVFLVFLFIFVCGYWILDRKIKKISEKKFDLSSFSKPTSVPPTKKNISKGFDHIKNYSNLLLTPPPPSYNNQTPMQGPPVSSAPPQAPPSQFSFPTHSPPQPQNTPNPLPQFPSSSPSNPNAYHSNNPNPLQVVEYNPPDTQTIDYEQILIGQLPPTIQTQVSQEPIKIEPMGYCGQGR